MKKVYVIYEVALESYWKENTSGWSWCSDVRYATNFDFRRIAECVIQDILGDNDSVIEIKEIYVKQNR